MINISNYETYLIDYLDGNLDAVQVSELLLFLEQHPDIKEEFEGIDRMHLVSVNDVHPNKDELKQPVFHEVAASYYPLLVDLIEQRIESKDLNKLHEAQKRYPELKREEALFAKTILLPETQIVYPNKKALKKSIPLFVSINLLARVAAVLLLLGSGWWYMQNTSVETTTADAETVKPKTNLASPITTPNNTGKERMQEAKTNIVRSKKEESIIPVTANQIIPVALVETKSAVVSAVEAEWKNETVLTRVNNRVAYTQVQTEQSPYKEIPELIVAGIQAQKEEILTENNKPNNKAIKPGDAGWAALNLLNKLTGANIKVVRTYDANGNKTGIEIAARDFEFSAK